MWYRAIPSAAITMIAAYFVPFYSPYITNMLDNGRPHRRLRPHVWGTNLLMRDEHLTGNMYTLKGIEDIPVS
uniref:NADH dehydrogenase [ubiquinone] 1 alpha subcomplex subunit 1 n=1 Tax=Trichuris muris TaxID=70415 RepID=A0A5S6QWM1_TRIMR